MGAGSHPHHHGAEPLRRPDQREFRMGPGALRLGIGRRLAVAAGLAAVLWLAVLWAVA